MQAVHKITMSTRHAGNNGAQPWWIAVPVRLAGALGLPITLAIGIGSLLMGTAVARENMRLALEAALAAGLSLLWTIVFLDMIRLKRWAVVVACGGAWLGVLGAFGAYMGLTRDLPGLLFASTALGLQFPPNVPMLIGLAVLSSPPPPMTFGLASIFLGPADLLMAIPVTVAAIAWRRDQDM